MRNKIIFLFACSMFCASDTIPEGDTLTALNYVLKHRYLECLDPAANQAAREEYNQIPNHLTPLIEGTFDAKNELKAYIKENFPDYNYDQIDSIVKEWMQIDISDYADKNFTPSILFDEFLVKYNNSGNEIKKPLGKLYLKLNNFFHTISDVTYDGPPNYSYGLGLLKCWEHKASFQEMAQLRASCSSVKS